MFIAVAAPHSAVATEVVNPATILAVAVWDWIAATATNLWDLVAF